MSEVPEPRWTHVALPVTDLDATVAFFEALTPLVLVKRNENDVLRGAWMSTGGQAQTPFVLVLGEFKGDQGRKFGLQPGQSLSMLNPWAHLGMEFPTRGEVDQIAAKARDMGLDIVWGPVDMGGDIGYTCGVVDPDGNTIEFTHDQRIYSTVQELWGANI